MSYDPQANDASRPVGTDPVSTLALELRRIKTRLNAVRTDVNALANTDIPAVEQSIDDILVELAGLPGVFFDNFRLLTGSGNFVVPANVTKLLIFYIGGGSGGQGGFSCFAKYNPPQYLACHTPKGFGAPGIPGEFKVSRINVVGGETIPYSCGSGGAGGAASNNHKTYNATPDFAYVMLEQDGYAASDPYTDAGPEVVVAVTINGTNINSIARYDDMNGSRGASGNDTTFGPVPSTATTFTARGGGYYGRHPDDDFRTGTLGQYGRGGNPGRSAWVNNSTKVIVDAQDGGNGTDGAILILW